MRSFMSRVTRLLILAAIVLVGAAITLYLMGGRTRQFSSQVTISAPRSLIFQFLTDAERLQRWAGSGAKIQPQGEAGHQVGTKWHLTIAANGTRWEFDSEVLETSADERLIRALSGPHLEARSDFRLDEQGQVTTLRHSLSLTPKGWARFVAPFSRDQIQRQLDAGLSQLKQAIEQEAQRAPTH